MAVVLAICISDSRLSCMRAPPEAATQMNGVLLSRAAWAPRAKRSPTTEPIEPPMNSNSKQASVAGTPRIEPLITTSASDSPVALTASCRRSGYLRVSLNFSVSTERVVWPISTRPSRSSSESMRARAPIRMW
ncbi:hypothetical protein D3C72_2052100 [compost metagenome]